MSILSHSTPTVNQVNHTPTGWDEIDQDCDAADRLAWHNDSDSNDPLDGYPGPGWQDDEPYQPTPEDRYEELGYSIGLTGVFCTLEEAHPAATKRDILFCSLGFSEGMYRGHTKHANQVGYELGLAGKPCERPESIRAQFDNSFALGWEEGAADLAKREAIVADFHQQLDWESAWEHEQREIDAIHRTVGWNAVSSLSLL